MMSEQDSGTLPACQRCRTRKIRCDRAGPKCSACTKSRASCVILDTVTNETYSRAYLHDLELRERELSCRQSGERTRPREAQEDEDVNQTETSNLATGGFIGESSGLK
jgi:hypothetical protein